MTTQSPTFPPFGTFALSAPLRVLRDATERMSWERGTRIARRLLKVLHGKPVDVLVFGDQKMRLHLTDNRTEKRIVCGSQFYDPVERAAIEQAVGGGKTPFVFVDAGANVGAYTFFARAALARSGRPGRVIAIEPDPVNADRLAVNLALNGAEDVTHIRMALSDVEGTVRFRSEGLENRGRARVADDGELELLARPLLALLADLAVTQVDVLKMDVEGHEVPILLAFLRDASEQILPGLVILETWHDRDEVLTELLSARGYVVAEQTGVNTIYARPPAAPEVDVDDGET